TVGGGLLRISRLPLLRIAPLRLKGLLRRPRRLFFTPHYHETDHAPYDYEAYQSHCQEDQHTPHIRPLLSFRLSLFAFADQPRHLRMLRIEPLYLAELLDRFRIMRVPEQLQPFAVPLVDRSFLIGRSSLPHEFGHRRGWHHKRETAHFLPVHRVAPECEHADDFALVVQNRATGISVSRGG